MYTTRLYQRLTRTMLTFNAQKKYCAICATRKHSSEKNNFPLGIARFTFALSFIKAKSFHIAMLRTGCVMENELIPCQKPLKSAADAIELKAGVYISSLFNVDAKFEAGIAEI